MTIIIFIVFFGAYTQYMAYRYDKKQWAQKREKQYSWIFRFMFIIALSQNNFWLIFAYGFLMWGLYDPLLNYLRKDIDDIWHLGSDSHLDEFNSAHPKWYRISRPLFICLGLGFYVLSWFHVLNSIVIN